MGILDTVLERVGLERRSADPEGDRFTNMHLAARAEARLGAATLTGIPAVHACVQLIAETTATLPLSLYRSSSDGGRKVVSRHPLHGVLHDQANEWQTAMEFREQLVASVLLTGNGYARIRLGGAGRVEALEPLAPGRTTPERLANGRIRYRVEAIGGGAVQLLTQDEVLHVKYRSEDGITGLSPIALARQTLENAAAQIQQEADFYAYGGRHMGVMQYDKVLTDNQRAQIREGLEQFMSNRSFTRALVLEAGITFNPMTLSQRDAQFVESRRLSLEDIARVFRVPPPMIGILENATYSNITEQSRMLVMHCLRPWLVRLEQAMNAALLTPASRRSMFIEHSAEGLLRGSTAERFEAYRVAREWGWMNVNEIRRLENLPGIGDAGDEYRAPMNTEALGGRDDGAEATAGAAA